jgi:ankyrin repeat protein
LATGADPNKQNDAGWTALMYAAMNSSPERGESSERTVEILLTVGGADPKMINNRGETAKDLAHESVKQIIDKYILAKKWKIPPTDQ